MIIRYNPSMLFQFLAHFFSSKKKGSLKLRDQDDFKEQLKGFKQDGTDPSELKRKGYPAWAVRAAGFSLKEMVDAGYGKRALLNAGFSASEIDEFFTR